MAAPRSSRRGARRARRAAARRRRAGRGRCSRRWPALGDGHGRDRRAALLRLRDGRGAAGHGGRRLARVDLGRPALQRGARRPPAPPSRRSPRSGCSTCSACRRARVGFVTGATMANLVGLAAARHRVLAERRLERRGATGSTGAPPVTVVVGEEVHVSLLKALRLLGFGSARAVRMPVDANGAMRATAAGAAQLDGPAIVCAQAGNVNTGACDPLADDRGGRARGGRLGARRRRVRDVGGGLAGAARPGGGLRRAPTRGRSTPTSGSTCPTTAASRSSPTPRRTPRRWAPAGGLPRRRRRAHAHAGDVAPRAPGARLRGAALPRAARGWPSWSSAAARTRAGWRRRWRTSTGARGAQRRRAQPGAA